MIMVFLGSVVSMASEILTLVEEQVSIHLKDKGVEEARSGIQALNKALHDHFVYDGSDTPESPFEKRFGVVVGDVTVGSIGLDPAIEKTLGGKAEAKAIAEGTAIILGYSAVGNATAADAMAKDRAEGKITAGAIDSARDRFLAVSENINMTLSTHEVNLRVEAPPGLADAIAQYGPAIAPVLQKIMQPKGGKK